MKLYSTTDVEKSVRRALRDFTHVVLNRGYTVLKPVFFNTGKLADLPVYQYASWIRETASQFNKWHDKGGVLISQDTHEGYACDVTVMVECPYSMDRLQRVHKANEEYGVIPLPVSWRTHEECVDTRFPEADLLKLIWTISRGQAWTDSELASEIGLSVAQVQYMKKPLNPRKMVAIEKRLSPDEFHLQDAWKWLEGGTHSAQAIHESGFKKQIEEMGKLGYVNLRKYHAFSMEEPDWDRLNRYRETALQDLAAVRQLVESLPAHPPV
jgi:hypothetical protein